MPFQKKVIVSPEDQEEVAADAEELVSLLKNEEPVLKKIMVIEDGNWVEKMLPGPVETDIEIEFEQDESELLPHWFEGRGQYMAHKWLSLNTRYSSKQLQKGWRPVRPEHYRDARYQTKKIPELGEVIVYMDVFLCEMPRERAELINQRVCERIRNERLARIWGLTQDTETLERATGGKATIIQEKEHLGIDNSSLSSLPYDSPMGREARALAERLQGEQERTRELNRRRQSQSY